MYIRIMMYTAVYACMQYMFVSICMYMHVYTYMQTNSFIDWSM